MNGRVAEELVFEPEGGPPVIQNFLKSECRRARTLTPNSTQGLCHTRQKRQRRSMDHIRLVPVWKIQSNHANLELEIRYMPCHPFEWGKLGEDLEGFKPPKSSRERAIIDQSVFQRFTVNPLGDGSSEGRRRSQVFVTRDFWKSFYTVHNEKARRSSGRRSGDIATSLSGDR